MAKKTPIKLLGPQTFLRRRQSNNNQNPSLSNNNNSVGNDPKNPFENIDTKNHLTKSDSTLKNNTDINSISFPKSDEFNAVNLSNLYPSLSEKGKNKIKAILKGENIYDMKAEATTLKTKNDGNTFFKNDNYDGKVQFSSEYFSNYCAIIDGLLRAISLFAILPMIFQIIPMNFIYMDCDFGEFTPQSWYVCNNSFSNIFLRYSVNFFITILQFGLLTDNLPRYIEVPGMNKLSDRISIIMRLSKTSKGHPSLKAMLIRLSICIFCLVYNNAIIPTNNSDYYLVWSILTIYHSILPGVILCCKQIFRFDLIVTNFYVGEFKENSKGSKYYSKIKNKFEKSIYLASFFSNILWGIATIVVFFTLSDVQTNLNSIIWLSSLIIFMILFIISAICAFKEMALFSFNWLIFLNLYFIHISFYGYFFVDGNMVWIAVAIGLILCVALIIVVIVFNCKNKKEEEKTQEGKTKEATTTLYISTAIYSTLIFIVSIQILLKSLEIETSSSNFVKQIINRKEVWCVYISENLKNLLYIFDSDKTDLMLKFFDYGYKSTVFFSILAIFYYFIFERKADIKHTIIIAFIFFFMASLFFASTFTNLINQIAEIKWDWDGVVVNDIFLSINRNNSKDYDMMYLAITVFMAFYPFSNYNYIVKNGVTEFFSDQKTNKKILSTVCSVLILIYFFVNIDYKENFITIRPAVLSFDEKPYVDITQNFDSCNTEVYNPVKSYLAEIAPKITTINNYKSTVTPKNVFASRSLEQFYAFIPIGVVFAQFISNTAACCSKKVRNLIEMISVFLLVFGLQCLFFGIFLYFYVYLISLSSLFPYFDVDVSEGFLVVMTVYLMVPFPPIVALFEKFFKTGVPPSGEMMAANADIDVDNLYY